MKVACISHGSIVPLNRRPYDLLAERHGVDITVLVPELWAGDLPAPAIRYAPSPGAPTLALPVRRSGNGSLFTLGGLRRALRGLAPDLLLLDEEPWSLVAWQTLRAGLRVPMIVYTKQNIAKRLPPPFSWIRRATYRRAHTAWAVGETTAEVLRATRFPSDITVIPHGVEIASFTPGKDEARRAELGLGGTVIGYAGRLVEEKGITDLLDAARQLLHEGAPAFTLLVVGAGPLAAEVDDAVRAMSGRLVHLPAVPHHEAPGIYRLCDIFVLPSRATPRWREQFGRALVEAAATAIPIVAAGTGEIPYVMDGLGGGGRLVAERSSESLAEALRWLLENPEACARIGAANLEAARRGYSQEAVAERMAGDLARVAAAPRGPA